MALRFRKSIKLAPGVRWNLSGSGSSWTLGPRGASVGIGKRGTFLNSGIPGTGLSSRSRLSGESGTAKRQSVSATTSVKMTCGIREDGSLYFEDASGVAVPDHLVETAKKQNREGILSLIQRKCDEINEQVEALARMHHNTPDSRRKPQFAAPTFSDPVPAQSQPRALGFLDKLFSSRRQCIEDGNAAASARHQDALEDWRGRKADFDRQVDQRRKLVESLIYTDVSAMETFLEESLMDIGWPRETLVAIDVQDSGKTVMLDVDLPELEDMPTKLAAVPARGLKLTVKDIAATKVQRLYAEHVHGIIFRLVGEVFAALPVAETVVASGYSQRREPTTAQMLDEYLLSVRVQRSGWETIDFEHASSIEVTAALARFDIRRDQLKSGKLRAIAPH